MTKIVYKRCSLTLDTETIRKSKELANQKAQSVSSFVRYLVVQARRQQRLCPHRRPGPQSRVTPAPNENKIPVTVILTV